MKKRQIKKNKSKVIKHELYVTYIKEVENEYNYIVYFKTVDNLKDFQVQILKYMKSYKYITALKQHSIKQSILKCYELSSDPMHLYIPKYKIKAINSRLSLCYFSSSK